MSGWPKLSFDPSLEQAAEDRHVSARAPVVAAAYMADPKQLADAISHVAMYLSDHPALVLALQDRDGCEVGYQLDRAIAHYLADKAQDDVLDAYMEVS